MMHFANFSPLKDSLGKKTHKPHGLGCVNCAVFSLHRKSFKKQHLEIQRAALFYS